MENTWPCNTPRPDGTCCQQQLNDKDETCPECGTVMKPAAPPKIASQVYTWPCQTVGKDGKVCGGDLKLEVGTNFCGKCGSEVGRPICWNCLRTLDNIDKFCQYCGKILISGTDSTPQQTEDAVPTPCTTDEQKKNIPDTQTKTTTEDMMTVVFHVIVESAFKFNREEENAYIDFKRPDLSKAKLQFVREVDDGSYLMRTEVEFPPEVLRNSLRYRYTIYRVIEGEQTTDREDDKNTKGRFLSLDTKSIQPGGLVHQRDGMMVKKSEDNMWKRAWTTTTNFVTRSQTKERMRLLTVVIKEMFPSWEGFCLQGQNGSTMDEQTAQNVGDQIQNLKELFGNWPVSEMLSETDQHQCFKRALKDYLQPRINQFKQKGNRSSESHEEASLRMSSALCMMYLTKTYMVDLSLEEKQGIMNALQVQPDESHRVCHDYNGLKHHYSATSLKQLASHLKTFIHRHIVKYEGDPTWLKCVPLLHFIERKSKPYEVPEVIYQRDHRRPVWWGDGSISNIVATFKSNSLLDLREQNLKKILKELAPLFTVDWLLPRTILACLSYTFIPIILEWGRMPPEAVLAMVFYHIHQKHISYADVKKYVYELSQMPKVIHNDTHGDQHSVRLCCVSTQACLDILTDLVDMKEKNYLIQDAVLCMIEATFHTLKARTELLSPPENDGEKVRHDFERLQDLMMEWLRNWTPKNEVTKRQLVTVSDLLSFDHPSDVENTWKANILSYLRERLKGQSQTIFNIYNSKIKPDQHHTELITFFRELALFTAESEMMKGEKSNLVLDNITPRGSEILSEVFMKHWPKSQEGVETSLNHILTQPNFTSLFRFYVNRYQLEEVAKDRQVGECLMQSLGLLTSVIDGLKNGDILVSQLRLILKHESVFVQNVEALRPWNQDLPSSEQLCSILLKRKKELDVLMEHKAFANYLTTLCKDIADLSVLESNLQAVNLDLPLRKLWEPAVYDPTTGSMVNRPSRTIFRFSAQDQTMLRTLLNLKKSHTFGNIWKKECKKYLESKATETTTQKCTIEDVVGYVWPRAETAWKDFCKRVRDGTVIVSDIEENMKDLYQDKRLIQKEVGFMFPTKEDPMIQVRLTEIQRCRRLVQYNRAAEVIVEAKITLQLQGDFWQLEEIRKKTNQKSATLESITEGVLKAGRALDCITEDHITCVKTYLECQPLIRWIRENVQKQEELKTLVDLALIAATGQGDMEVTKVNSLRSVVNGFAPLIYKLEKGAGFKEFVEKIQMVLGAYKTDKHLLSKLTHLNRQLDWLAAVKEAQGDIEVNALEQVTAINSRGVYSVGYANKGNSKVNEDLIRVKVSPLDSEDPDKRKKTKEYSGSDLKELQSKLMLVAGKAEKGKEEVESFVEKFDDVTALANTYVNLCKSGNILFETWTATFYCKPQSGVNVVVNFSDHTITGRSNVTVTQQMSQVGQFMERCLKDWKGYMKKKRAQFPELNHYTTEQLIILRKHLTDPKARHLLQEVDKNCTSENLHEAIREAVTEGKALEASVQEVDRTLVADDIYESDIFKEMSKIFTPIIIQRALKRCRNDLSKLEECCIELEDQEIETVKEVAETSQPLAFLQSRDTLKSITKHFMEDLTARKRNIGDELEELWIRVMDSASESMADCLSIRDLGMILKNLSDKVQINRKFPGYLKTGQPNLIICPQSEVITRLLSVYMENEEMPMPSRNEVLFCDEDTTAEEVELLIRRAVSYETGQIFMLANAQKLNYERAQQAEGALEEHTPGKVGYKFVVICSSEQQERSQLVTALDNYRVNIPEPPSLESVQTYLLTHLQGDNPVSSACKVDPENCCVMVVRSERAGAGKTLWIRRKGEQLRESGECQIKSLPLYGTSAKITAFLEALLGDTQDVNENLPSLYHINIPHEMHDGVDHLLFNLVVLGSLVDPTGQLWHRRPRDMFAIETSPLLRHGTDPNDSQGGCQYSVHHILDLLPTITCRMPMECLLQHNQSNKNSDNGPWEQHMDEAEFNSEPFQRVYQYLKRHSDNGDFTNVEDYISKGSPEVPLQSSLKEGLNTSGESPTNLKECLSILLCYCGLDNPSWAELAHFVQFLNVQLKACNQSGFCTIADANTDDTLDDNATLPGFMKFVVRFMIEMSKDFSTRSLHLAEETDDLLPGVEGIHKGPDATENGLLQFQLKRRWETSPHPYIFFHHDGSMTFLGFVVRPPNYDVVDPQKNTVIERRIMDRGLFQGLRVNGVNLAENFDTLPRKEQIAKMCLVMGTGPHDPDSRYVLTADNAKKILAILMRFRANIPVVIMGETGCGKTYLIKFMCSLQCPPGKQVKNMMLVKVHGGTTAADLVRKVTEAQELAKQNRKKYPGMFTVLFLDEVNTTEALGLVKEVLCDNSLNGRPLGEDCGLRLIAACNPYRKHAPEIIQKLEKAGLGYHVTADETKDRLGTVPMRQLVYRVQPLPQSLLPLVWDFGQLQPDAEKLFIIQIVRNKMLDPLFGGECESYVRGIANILATAQEFMRKQQGECSFVSLRDVERTLNVMSWFYAQKTLFDMMDEMSGGPTTSALTRSLILALGVCYQACLQDEREKFRDTVCRHLNLPNGIHSFDGEISLCQDVFLKDIELGPNIACNQALKENVFMMVVCIELRLPLFLVGKPGSSKSLAKSIVANAMQGPMSSTRFYKTLKEVSMVSYQCSPHSTADGIIRTFRQCAKLQKVKRNQPEGNPLHESTAQTRRGSHSRSQDKFVAVVVLEEIGLAEDSTSMPLKALHPLLEDGCEGDDIAEEHKKVGFIGISNWALDPAKMNRGILVQRKAFEMDELEKTARDICSSDKLVSREIEHLIRPLVNAYLHMYNQAITDKREFYGLRDFYSLVKMLFGFAKKNMGTPTWHQIQHALLRNFGGLDCTEPVRVFSSFIEGIVDRAPQEGDPDNTPRGLIHASMSETGDECGGRYLLVLTENYAALTILENMKILQNATIIYGSSFPSDQDYVVVCRNINQIKVCMETGQTVVLLNLESLYESLYDLLNQYYARFGGLRHVDLGLGTHRVKSRVHPSFKLIVVAEKDVVYKRFPIPLVNRLEKHFIDMRSLLSEEQLAIVQNLSVWAERLADVHHQLSAGKNSANSNASDVFIGYHKDTCATLVLQVCHQIGQTTGADLWRDEVLHSCQGILLQSATPEAILRVGRTHLQDHKEEIMTTYFVEQNHNSLIDYLKTELEKNTEATFVQVTTHSRLLPKRHLIDIADEVGLPESAVSSVFLQTFSSKQQFLKLIREYFTMPSDTDQVLLIQCDSGDKNAELIACARFCIKEEYQNLKLNVHTDLAQQEPPTRRHIVIVVQLPRVAGGCFLGFQGDMWQSVHLDELSKDKYLTPPVMELMNQSISDVFCTSVQAYPDTSSTGQESVPAEPTMDGEPFADDTDVTENGHRSDREVLCDEIQTNTDTKELPDEVQTTTDTKVLCDEVQTTTDTKELPDEIQTTMDTKELPDEIQTTTDTEVLCNEIKSKFNFSQILRSSVHAAAAMLKDKDVWKNKERNYKLLDLLRDDANEDNVKIGETTTFTNILTNRIYLLLKEKEETKMNPSMAKAWLCDDVASVEAVNRAGTFRRALWKHLEMKITLMLAGTIAFIETNHNLELIRGSNPWKEKMWLNLFKSQGLTPLFYKDLVSVKKGTELKEVTVQMTGANGTEMRCQLPFSWLLKRDIDILIYQTKTAKGNDEEVMLSVGHLLKQSPWWPILEAAFTEAGHEVVRDCYLEDYVRMVYKPQSGGKSMEDEVELVKKAILSTIVQLEGMTKVEERDVSETSTGGLRPEHILPMIHIAEAAINSRVQLFTEIVTENDQVVEHLVKFYEKHPEHPLATVMSIDVLAVKYIIETIQPTYQLLRNREASRKWQEKVEATSPLVNTILTRANNLETSGIGGYSQACRRELDGIGANWNRVTTVKLFVELVYPEGSHKEKDINKYGPMFFRRLEDADFKTENTFKTVEDFLKYIIKSTSAETPCRGCTNPLIGANVMPCGHEACEGCVSGQREGTAPCVQCLAPKQSQSRQDSQSNQIYAFKQRCNAFLMETVSRMCFAGTTPPEPGVVNMLMGYITKLSLFNEDINPTPVVRSVLLKLLLRSSINDVHQHLVEYFTYARTVATNRKDVIELAVLYIQCLEDHYFTASSTLLKHPRVVQEAIRLLEESCTDLLKYKDEVTQLEGIAKIHFGLSFVAEWLINIYVKKEIPVDRRMIEALFGSAEAVCLRETRSGPSVFLTRQLVRRYSFNEFQQVVKECPWVVPEEAREEAENPPPDIFAVYGRRYTNIRDTLNQTIIDGNAEHFTHALGETNLGSDTDVRVVLLALFREINLTHMDNQRQLLYGIVQSIHEACKTIPELMESDDFVKDLLNNTLAKQCRHLKVSPALSHEDLALLEVVVHFMTSASAHSPMIDLVINPGSLQGTFLPTMPEDERREIHEVVLLAARRLNENPFLYECPNGHPYVIGDCGRPYFLDRCPECGESIGGQGHLSVDGNRKAELTDQTKPGHCLGPAANRSLVPAPERTMSPACTALVRLLVHIGMYVGANSNQQEIHTLITPTIRQADVPDFLWQHMLCDLEVLSQAIGKGKDDTLLLVHLLIRDFGNSQDASHDARLVTKQARRTWEKQFSGLTITPLLNELDDRLRNANQQITSDVRQGSNILRCMIHESEIHDELAAPNKETEPLEVEPSLWRFRTRVSIEHLTQALTENMAAQTQGDQQSLQQYALLHLFLEKEPLLRVVQLIPNILELLKRMSEVYHRKIDRSEADSMKVKDFLRTVKDDAARKHYETLVRDFAMAWTRVHPYLQTHGVLGQVLPQEFCTQDITQETPLSTFLPSRRGRGMSAIVLLDYLTTVHNIFVRDYCQIAKRTCKEVSFPDLTPAHLITYDPDRDLLPLVMANCTYSLEVGQGTKIEYDFKHLEQQLEERLLKGKRFLDSKNQLEPISFREDLNNALLFERLRAKIQQTSFTSVLQNELRADTRIMVDVSDSLTNLDTTIGFLVSMGGDPEVPLLRFMTETLKMEGRVLTERASQRCKLCHTEALWLLFSHEREKLALRNNQPLFTSVDSREYSEELSDNQRCALEEALRQMKVNHFLGELHECILLHITIKASQYDEDHVDNKKQSLAVILSAYIDSKDGPEIAALTKGTFPANIRVEQCVDTWRAACQYMQAASNK